MLGLEEFDSFMDKSSLNPFRKLEVDNPLVFFLGERARVFLSSADVIHSFALPALAIKVDAVPGRLNEFYIFPLQLGKFYGQCSEICGANHAYMPISAEVIALAQGLLCRLLRYSKFSGFPPVLRDIVYKGYFVYTKEEVLPFP